MSFGRLSPNRRARLTSQRALSLSLCPVFFRLSLSLSLEKREVDAIMEEDKTKTKKSSYKLTSGPSDEEYNRWRKFTKSQVARHATISDGWIIVHDRVYDITSFAKTHPGFNNAGQVSTALAIARSLGKDATEEFTEIHSLTAWKQLKDFQIGVACREGDDALARTSDVAGDEHHVIPKWLSDDRDFWVRYSGGVDGAVLRYLTKNGYPQGDVDEDLDDDGVASSSKPTKKEEVKEERKSAVKLILAFVVAPARFPRLKKVTLA
jgi:cytochrome b involved in lipid metabolism